MFDFPRSEIYILFRTEGVVIFGPRPNSENRASTPVSQARTQKTFGLLPPPFHATAAIWRSRFTGQRPPGAGVCTPRRTAGPRPTRPRDCTSGRAASCCRSAVLRQCISGSQEGLPAAGSGLRHCVLLRAGAAYCCVHSLH